MTRAKSTAARNVNPESIAEKNPPVTPEVRYRMIAEGAYFRAAKRGFVGGDMGEDWLLAEAEIDRLLQQRQEPEKTAVVSPKQAFLERLEAAHRDWDARLHILKTMASEAKTGLREELRQEIEAVAAKWAAIEVRTQELRQRAEGAGEDLKEGLENAWKELQDALHRLASRLK